MEGHFDRLHQERVQLPLGMKGEFTTERLSDTDAATKRVGRKVCRPNLDLSPGKGCLRFNLSIKYYRGGQTYRNGNHTQTED